MRTSDAVAEALEDSISWRRTELNDLKRVSDEAGESRSVVHRALAVMLYAHLEGFTKNALDEYASFISSQNLNCSEVLPILATSSLKNLFKAFSDPNSGRSFLPPHLRDDLDLRRPALEAEFIQNSRVHESRKVVLDERYVDTESNLDSKVLRKNLFRLGLNHDEFSSETAVLQRLIRLRHHIAHGVNDTFQDLAERDRIFQMVLDAMVRIKNLIIQAIDSTGYLRSAT